MEKESCTNFCGALISSQEIMKLQNFESDVSDVIPANVQNISSLTFTQFYRCFDHHVLTIAHELIKLQSFE